MQNYQKYINYFENLCVQHTLIDHNPANNVIGFFRINLEELLTSIRQSINSDGYFFVLTNYIWRPKGNSKEIELMFFVLGNAKTQDFEDETRVMNFTEEIAEDFIKRIHLDSRKEVHDENSFFYGSQDKINIDNAVPVLFPSGKNHIGWQVSLTITPFFKTCTDVSKWDDLTNPDEGNPNNY